MARKKSKNPYSGLEAQIRSALKRSNQRIAQIGKTYGTNSSVYKQEAGKFLKGAFAGYTTTSQGGKEWYRKDPNTGEKKLYAVAKGGNIKFDIKKIMKDLKKEGASPKMKTLLAEIAGIRLYQEPIKDAQGNITGYEKEIKLRTLPKTGVSTLTQIRKRTEKKLERMGIDPGDYSNKEIDVETERLAEFSENFQTTYDAYMSQFGQEEAEKDNDIKMLYGKNRERRLTRDEFIKIKDKMDQALREEAEAGLQFEKNEQENDPFEKWKEDNIGG